MTIEEKYLQSYKHLDNVINERFKHTLYPAMGYTSNLDIICEFQIDVLNELLHKYLKGKKLSNMQASKNITTIQELLETIVYFCIHGIGGEVDIEDVEIVKNNFTWKYGMGGTATQAAMALSEIGCPSIVHLTDVSKEVCDILVSPNIFTVSETGMLVHTNEIVNNSVQEVHCIIQYKKGDIIRLENQEIEIPASNRLIITKVTVNEFVPFSKAYFEYIEKYAGTISSNVLSSFNALLDKTVLKEHLDYVIKHVKNYKKNNPKGITFYEDAHYHNEQIKKMCIENLYSNVDIVSLNEEELEYTLKMYNFNIDIKDIISCVKGMKYIRETFGIHKGVIVHTKDYSMYVGDIFDIDIESGLMYGNMLATAKAMNEWYGNKEQINKVMELPLSEQGLSNREKIMLSTYNQDVIVVPTKYIDKPKYTIGLGDTFVAGVQLCFI